MHPCWWKQSLQQDSPMSNRQKRVKMSCECLGATTRQTLGYQSRMMTKAVNSPLGVSDVVARVTHGRRRFPQRRLGESDMLAEERESNSPLLRSMAETCDPNTSRSRLDIRTQVCEGPIYTTPSLG